MNSIERVKNSINLKNIDKIPIYSYGLTKESDILGFRLAFSNNWKQKKYPPLIRDEVKEKNAIREDEWGVLWGFSEIPGAVGQVLESPLKDLKRLRYYIFPDPYAEGRFENFKNVVNDTDKYIKFMNPSVLFERLHFLHGFNETLLDLIIRLDEIEIILDKILDFQINLIKNLGKTFNGKVHGVWTTDDWGTQNSIIINPKLWRKIFKPRYKKIINEVHKNNMDFWFHSDGKIEDIIPDLIEIGVDVFNFPQPSSVLGIKEFGERFASSACFTLTVDIQTTAVFGTKKQIIQEAEDLVKYWSTESGSGVIAYEYFDYISIGSTQKKSKIALDAFKDAFFKKLEGKL